MKRMDSSRSHAPKHNLRELSTSIQDMVAGRRTMVAGRRTLTAGGSGAEHGETLHSPGAKLGPAGAGRHSSGWGSTWPACVQRPQANAEGGAYMCECEAV